jgi:hypothetical protein
MRRRLLSGPLRQLQGLPAYPHVSSRILTDAHVCSRMLTYADAEGRAGVGVGQ